MRCRNIPLATTSCIDLVSVCVFTIPVHLYLPSFSGWTSSIIMDLSDGDVETERFLNMGENSLSSFSTIAQVGEIPGENIQGIVNGDPSAAYSLMLSLDGWIIPKKEKFIL